MAAKRNKINPGELADFLSHCHRRRYPAKTTIIRPSTRSHTLYLIIRGKVSITLEHKDGRELVLKYLHALEFFGEGGLFAPQENHHWLKTRTECELAEISHSRFLELVETNPKLLIALTGQICQRLESSCNKLAQLAFLDVKERIWQTLQELCHEPDSMTHPEGMQLRITRQEIGRIVSCSREMVGRVLTNLSDEGLISVCGKTIVVFGMR